ncbi:PKD domain-containing protein [Candidatus Kaiserbacteria bacterium]|nr:PKD domain-containing protein [Candidatus Kaiserbacteria bacterium]
MKAVSTAAFLFFITAAAAWTPVYAAELVNINTADSAALQTLNGIGPSKAQAIIDYRTQHGSFAKIEDIQNVSGIGTATYNNIKDYITVGSSVSQTQSTSTTTSTQTQTQTTSTSGGNGPPPITLRVEAQQVVTAGGGSFFGAAAYGTEGLPLPGARFIWNFGDGTVAEGPRIFHAYSYPGNYALSVTGAYNYSSAIEHLRVEATPAQVSCSAEGDGSLLIRNRSNNELDIGLWSLTDGGESFVIPEDTVVLAGEGVRFAPAVTHLSGSTAATLRYPNGVLAAAAVPGADSPLRGERVPAASLKVSAAPKAVSEAVSSPLSQEPETETLAASVTSSPATQSTQPMLWTSLLALAGVLVAGVAGVHYAGRRKGPGTSSAPEEFEIEQDP